MDKTKETMDYLSYIGDTEINALIKDEQILFSDKIIKINRYNMSQERNLVITNKAIYNLKKKCMYKQYIYSSIHRFKEKNSINSSKRSNGIKDDRRIRNSWQ